MRLIAVLFVLWAAPTFALSVIDEFGPDAKALWQSGIPRDANKMENAIIAYTLLIKNACKWGPGVNLETIDGHPRELACYKDYRRKNPFQTVSRKYLTQ